jgi:PadR family transcriptional regulator PadR
MAPRMTLQTQLVLRTLLAEPSQGRYGLEISELTGLPTGTIYPIMARLEAVRWVESTWEQDDSHPGEGRPRRRYYHLTPDGIEQSRLSLAQAYRPAASGGRLAGIPWPEPGTAQ